MADEPKPQQVDISKPQIIILERRGRVAFWFAIFFLILFAASLFINLVLGAAVYLQHPQLEKPQKYQVKIVQGEGKDRALLLPIQGVIVGETHFPEGVCNTTPEMVEQQLHQASEDPSIKAVILYINSPGGMITATDKIYRAIMKFKEANTKDPKPVIAYIDTMAASGGYYVACAADHIIAHETSITGSIGVLMSFFKIKGLLGKLGVEPVMFKRGDFKDIGCPSRDMTPEEVNIINSILDEMYQRFTSIVKERRGLPDEVIKEVAQGQVFTGKQAQVKKLVDDVGYFQNAVTFAEKKTKTALQVVRYYRSGSLFEELLKVKESDITKNLLLIQNIQENVSPQFLYIWRP